MLRELRGVALRTIGLFSRRMRQQSGLASRDRGAIHTMRLIQAFQVFFRVLGDAAFAARLVGLRESKPEPAPVPAPPPAAPLIPAAAPTVAGAGASRRSDALTLLAVLQREGRLVDFLQESIDGYPDAQVGAAVREVHRGCRAALDRMFGLGPAIATPEGGVLRIEKGLDPCRVRLTGPGAGAGTGSGTVVHAGWEATRCELPVWTGGDVAARVVAPAEIETR